MSNPFALALYNQPGVPADYADQLDALAPTIVDKIEETQTPGESWIDTLARILPSVLASVQQKQLLDVQIERARAGLPPLDVSQYTPGVSVGLSQSTKELIMYGGIAALGIWAFSAYGKYRR